MAKRTELIFKIEGHTRDTLPMARLAEYMGDLAALLGSPERVHFDRLEDGSVCLVQKIEEEVSEPVRRRVAVANQPNAPEDVKRAYAALNSRLQAHDAVGRILDLETGAEILPFPGKETPKPLEFGSISRHGSLDGELQMVGGKGDTVPVHVGEYTACRAKRQLVKEMAPFLFSPIRVFGQGRWKRDKGGKWCLDHFLVTSFDSLDPRPLSEALTEIRKIGDRSWIEEGLESQREIEGGADD